MLSNQKLLKILLFAPAFRFCFRFQVTQGLKKYFYKYFFFQQKKLTAKKLLFVLLISISQKSSLEHFTQSMPILFHY